MNFQTISWYRFLQVTIAFTPPQNRSADSAGVIYPPGWERPQMGLEDLLICSNSDSVVDVTRKAKSASPTNEYVANDLSPDSGAPLRSQLRQGRYQADT